MSPFVSFEMRAFGVDLLASLEITFVHFSSSEGFIWLGIVVIVAITTAIVIVIITTTAIRWMMIAIATAATARVQIVAENGAGWAGWGGGGGAGGGAQLLGPTPMVPIARPARPPTIRGAPARPIRNVA